jgi:glycosyltransferase involved in cell wall biosynthesis/tetratricopeptide (TPR) repeat protein
MNPPFPGTVIVYGPFFARSGFGVLARGTAMGLHLAGVNVRIVPVDCNDPKASGDLDDVDLHLLQSLKFTPVVGPVTAIFAYVPTYLWPKLPLPEPSRRILLTTFDSSADAATPPSRLIFIGNEMDQVWVANQTEKTAWIRGGLDPERIHFFNWAHEWIDNSRLGPLAETMPREGQAFRFLHISLFLPRRRLDVLIRAFFEEFRGAREAELYLKMSYPSWHPVPGKPKKDLEALVERLRRETYSKASVVIDEALGTRKELARLIDQCHAYVSPDTTHTAPVTEAMVRNLPVIITDGWGVDLPPQAVVVPNGSGRVAITAEMAEYMPHQKGATFATLEVPEMRRALRRVFALGPEERKQMVGGAMDYMRERYSYEATAPAMIDLIRKAQAETRRPVVEVVAGGSLEPASPEKALNIHWGGLQLFHGKIPKWNREVGLELVRRGHHVSLTPGNGPFHIEELDLAASPGFRTLASRFHQPLPGEMDVNVSCRWHPVFNELAAKRQILGSSWWSGPIPTDWVRPINEGVDRVWVPSGFVRDQFLAGGVDAARLAVVPMGVDPKVFHPEAAPFPLKTRKRFKFLFVGETSRRRGFDVLLAAYLRVFKDRDDVCLVVKDMDCEDYYARLHLEKMIGECIANPRCPQIEYIPRMLSEQELAGLYVACDCLVLPHRTASFNLAALEAMACGRPVITTDFGGVREFVSAENAYLVPAKIVSQKQAVVGHWRVTGERVHAEVDQKALEERLRHVVQNGEEAADLGRRAGVAIRRDRAWSGVADRVVEQMRTTLAAPSLRTPTAQTAVGASMSLAKPDGPTVVMFAPFYNRSGYGVAARCLAAAWSAVGIKLRIMPVDGVEEGVDDCDLEWLRSLEKTPVTQPVVAVFFHVATPEWLKVSLPPNSARILFTTFDGTAQGLKPPPEWVAVCNEMDQLWLQTDKEAERFVAAGVPKAKIQVLKCPHPWIGNAALPAPMPRETGAKFRFLCVAMFQPRRRWDALIEAFLAEFKDAPDVELCLKVNYPSWHPVSGQPARDLRNLIESLRAKTGSSTPIILDEDLGTRAGICRVIDSCDAYVSTDTTITAPVGEAFVRGKIAVIPDGYGAALPYCESTVVIPVDPALKRPMTEEMLQYQPHHRGRDLPLLRVEDVRRALRAAYELPEDRRREMGRAGALFMECTYGPAVVTPPFVRALEKAALAHKGPPVRVSWEGSYLDYGSLSGINRSLTAVLAKRPEIALFRVGSAALQGTPAKDAGLQALSKELRPKAANDVRITVRHQWPPDWSRPKTGALVVIQPWEFGSLPKEWAEASRHVDEFWVPSNHVRRVYVDSGVAPHKVVVVPNAVDVTAYHPGATPLPLATRKKTKLLFVGGTIGRKGPDVLLKGYLRAFTAADDVCLVIKDFGGASVYQGMTFSHEIEAARQQPDAPEILYLDQEMAPEDMPGLYAACDCLVHPYRGEGFGLPVLEAMACGLPVVVTRGGATDDFVTEECGWLLRAQKRMLGDSVGKMPLVGNGWWLEPDVDDLVRILKTVVARPDEARARGIAGAAVARKKYSWEQMAGRVVDRIRVLAARPLPKTGPEKRLVLSKVAWVGHIGDARDAIRSKKLRKAWELVSAAIAARPFHPEGWLLLGQIADEAGDVGLARRCAARGVTLVPDWKPVQQFAQSLEKRSGKQTLDWPLPVVSDKPRLTVCLIAKNEERFLGQCLASVKDLADEIVVVDTGSTDRTVEIARSFGAKLGYFEWSHDFSAARNAALELATGDWILVLDADEELMPEHKATIHAEMAEAGTMAWRLPLINVGKEADGVSHVPRLFRNAPALFYVGRVHEQVFTSIEVRRAEWGLDNKLGKTRLLHHGYTEELTRDRNKVERNLRLLEEAMKEIPGDANLTFNHGLELVRSGKLEAGLVRYSEAAELLGAQAPDQIVPELREVILTQWLAILKDAGRFEDLLAIRHQPLMAKGPLSPSMHYMLGFAALRTGDLELSVRELEACLAARDVPGLTPMHRDLQTCAPEHCLALARVAAKQPAAARDAFALALQRSPEAKPVTMDFARFEAGEGDYGRALTLIYEVVQASPDDVAAWRLGAAIALNRPEVLEVALDWTGSAREQHPDDEELKARRAEALLLAGRPAEALPLFAALGTETSASNRAALLVCRWVAVDGFRPSPADVADLNQAFLQWYRRLVDWNSAEVVQSLNVRMDDIARVLPGAASFLQSVLADLGA